MSTGIRTPWSGNAAPGSTQGLENDWSRVLLFAIVGLAALFGLWHASAANKPQHVLRESVSRTVRGPFTASIEGRVTIGDSLVATYRTRESSVPGRGISVQSDAGSARAPYNSRELLDLLRDASRVVELGREDVYGHPARHFSGELPNGATGFTGGCRIEFWADMRNLSAVRLVMLGVHRGAAVDARGDSLPGVTSLTIRYIASPVK